MAPSAHDGAWLRDQGCANERSCAGALDALVKTSESSNRSILAPNLGFATLERSLGLPSDFSPHATTPPYRETSGPDFAETFMQTISWDYTGGSLDCQQIFAKVSAGHSLVDVSLPWGLAKAVDGMALRPRRP